jgi:NAD-dependent SIR2 family protein deacetylase
MGFCARFFVYPARTMGIGDAARQIANARGILVTAGAGMGVDSGLPDFRGNEGFWRAYPPFKALGLSFVDLANPRWFASDPRLAWGFYGHRLALYRDTVPHAGFALLASWARRAPAGAFVFTSNVDGQFQRAGFQENQVFECHGSIHHLQCAYDCGAPMFSAEAVQVQVNPRTCLAEGTLPTCPGCGRLARPAILMFGDNGWDSSRSDAQEARLDAWLGSHEPSERVVIECGAGTHVPTVRMFGDQQARAGALLVRINVREPEVPKGHLGLPMRALEGLRALDGACRDLASTP